MNKQLPNVWAGWKSARATIKHSLSLRQIVQAFNIAYDQVMRARGGWVLSNTVASGLGPMELKALAEEGLIALDGMKFTLTRDGFERHQYYQYAINTSSGSSGKPPQ